MKTKIIGILVITLLIATVIPAVGILNEKEPLFIGDNFKLGMYYQKDYTSANLEGSILWDNGMHYHGFFGSQWDPAYPLDVINADDFQFDEAKSITNVNWIGGYFNPCEDGDFDWNITFYTDGVEGNIPGEVFYKEIFPNSEVHETYIGFFEGPEDGLDSYIFSYWVDLAEPITFNSGQKYWISIQGLGAFPPQTHWALHIPSVNHNVFIQSNYFGWPDWTDILDTPLSFSYDACFQLVGDGDPVAADLEGKGGIVWENVCVGSIINDTIEISNIGDTGSMLEWKVQSVPEEWGINWSVRWYFNGLTAPFEGGFVGTTKSEVLLVEVQAPDEKNKEFTGEIVLVNSDNPDDTCTINLVCKTPKSRELNQFHLLIEKLCEQFPILRYLL